MVVVMVVVVVVVVSVAARMACWVATVVMHTVG